MWRICTSFVPLLDFEALLTFLQFNRGRPENLIDHVARKCSVLSQEERDDFLARYHQSRPAQSRRTNGEAGEAVASTSVPDVSALNTLAEVSRQHSHIRSSPTRDTSQAGQPVENNTILDQLREHGFPQRMSPEAAVKASLSNLVSDNNDGNVASAAAPSTMPAGAQQDIPTSNATTGSTSASLQMTALSALDPMLEHYATVPITLVDYAVPTRAQHVNDPKPNVRVVSHHAEQLVKQPGQYHVMTGRLEVTHFPDSFVYLTAPWITTTADVVLLNNESDTVSDRMKGYIFKVLSRITDAESSAFQVSHFIRHTLRFAIGLCDGSQVRSLCPITLRCISLT